MSCCHVLQYRYVWSHIAEAVNLKSRYPQGGFLLRNVRKNLSMPLPQLLVASCTDVPWLIEASPGSLPSSSYGVPLVCVCPHVSLFIRTLVILDVDGVH